ncbi:MAG: outer membrane protein assembly factor BamD [Proteobacteria bacterium]|nr:outer membrane protein assembly factor BamD [Pseudomonadota bacterium]
MALELYQKAIAANPTAKQVNTVLLQMGMIAELNLKKKELAELYYEEGLKKKESTPERVEILKRLSNLYLEENKNPEKALPHLSELINYQPAIEDRDLLFFKRAKAKISLNKMDEARNDLESLLRVYPTSAFAASADLVRAETYFFEGKHQVAEQELLGVANRHPHQEQAQEAEFLRAQCLESDQKYKEALKVYEGLKGKYPNPQVLQERMKALRKRIQKSK